MANVALYFIILFLLLGHSTLTFTKDSEPEAEIQIQKQKHHGDFLVYQDVAVQDSVNVHEEGGGFQVGVSAFGI